MKHIGLKDRSYWFFRNLLSIVLIFIIGPIYILWAVSGAIFILFFVTDGSTVLIWPLEWNWGEITYWRD